MRRLCLILGDQLDRDSSLFDAFNPELDCLWMAEVVEESTHVWSHKQRIALFLSAMRHFAEELREKAYPLTYLKLGEHRLDSLAQALAEMLRKEQVQEVYVVRPGDYRVLAGITRVCQEQGIPLCKLTDQHFLSTPKAFSEWARGRKQLRIEVLVWRVTTEIRCINGEG